MQPIIFTVPQLMILTSPQLVTMKPGDEFMASELFRSLAERFEDKTPDRHAIFRHLTRLAEYGFLETRRQKPGDVCYRVGVDLPETIRTVQAAVASASPGSKLWGAVTEEERALFHRSAGPVTTASKVVIHPYPGAS